MMLVSSPSLVTSDLPDVPLAPARILVVDDDERNLLALSQVLADLGDVVTTTSGRGALRHLLQGEFAVILLDVFMPGMDGYEVASLIRDRRQTAHIPIIFLSAVNKETEHLMRGYAMGAVDYVFKPVDPVVLKSKVGVFVDLYNMRAQVEAKGRDERLLREQTFRAELEKLQMERELEKSRLRQASMLEALPLALYEATVDDDGRLQRTFVGGDLSRIAGADAAAIEAGDLRWEDRIHPEDVPTVSGAEPGSNPGEGGAMSLEYRWVAEGRGVRHFIEQCVRISDDGEEARWAGTLIDVTERKQLEAKLLQAGKVEAIGRLTGGVAHDFNNLLAAVLGGLHLLQKRASLGERDQLVIDRMRHAAEKGVELVRRMMAFARKQDLQPVAIEPDGLCASVAGLVEHTIGGTITVQWQCEAGGANFFVDRSQLELGLVNLILNARDAMPRGGTITVNIRRAEEDEVDRAGLAAGPYLSVCVADEGTGIPEAIISKITEPFFTTKEAGKGTGLGLSMVMGFVHQSGGKLEVQSREGAGTRITFYLPATHEQAAGKAPEILAPATAEDCRKSILVVDDDEAVRTVLVEQLREWGMEVASAVDGKAALEALAATPDHFDILLTDYAMPGINGAELIDRVVAMPNAPRCLLMTGYADEQVKIVLPPEVPLLHKPLDHNLLMSSLCLN
ncbi:response regulator [Novosphingobium sp. KCTC 2891]|uniref:response regulator n=1 Tax=Novosphingobium sp. KCTC 2891 TaxID=2989730 RepID=UPI002223C695|nr:response regulator [Novosphingobium sp. KCTC 2891]MCW1384063.1 response regulator [Novosphingobium sp. KCTC 2891]